MTREEAARVLEEKVEVWEGVLKHMLPAGDSSELKQIEDYETALRMAAAALRGPEPDPETGLVPCGCGGKAEICGSSGDDESYSLECWECGTSSRCYDTKKEAKAAWNRAMGHKEDA